MWPASASTASTRSPSWSSITETTGLRPEAGDRVVSLAGVRVRAGSSDANENIRHAGGSGREVPEESVRIHGITPRCSLARRPGDRATGVPRVRWPGRAGRARGLVRPAVPEPEARRLACRRSPSPVPSWTRASCPEAFTAPGVTHAGRRRAATGGDDRWPAFRLGDALITAEVLVRRSRSSRNAGSSPSGRHWTRSAALAGSPSDPRQSPEVTAH